MLREILSIAACLFGLVGCAGAPSVPSFSQVPWQDDAFAYDSALVVVTKNELFGLDPELAHKLKDPALPRMSKAGRLQHLLTLLYGQELKNYSYNGEHSTIAAETWRQKHGDCLSLTVLAFSMARAMDLNAQMQEVRVPVFFDRRGTFDFVSSHVNVRIQRTVAPGQFDNPPNYHDTIIDFEPSITTRQLGAVLSDNAILARYYNNIAVEYLAKDLQPQAYAHFKAAILADPGYAASYTNLALLYQRASLTTDAEVLLRQAIAMPDASVIPLLTLEHLLTGQGRHAEVQELAKLMQSRRDLDPYYWIGLGVRHFQDGQYRESIAALEHAISLTSGFEEVHRYLALAYWRAGELSRANEQLTLLGSMSHDQRKLMFLRKKFNAQAP